MKHSLSVYFYKLLFEFKKQILQLFNRFQRQPYLTRDAFLSRVPPDAKILEIGPFTIPSISGPNVDYFDVLSREQLLERAIRINYPHEQCPFIKYVSPTGDLSIVDETYDYILSSHCIEHQPDLIQHLADVNRLLRPEGRYVLVIPDKRYCMDAFLPESTLQDILQAHEEKRKIHTLRSVVEHRALRAHNKAWLHWIGKHGKKPDSLPLIEAAMQEYHAAGGSYIDVHAWQFTPDSFKDILETLLKMKLSPFSVEEIYPTRPGDFEFYVLLKRVNSFNT
jgi:SAM-dependent methyltransferase